MRAHISAQRGWCSIGREASKPCAVARPVPARSALNAGTALAPREFSTGGRKMPAFTSERRQISDRRSGRDRRERAIIDPAAEEAYWRANFKREIYYEK